MTVKFRCEEHKWEWFADHAGCPRCLKAQRDELLEAAKLALSIVSEFRLASTDQNPKGFRDILGAAIAKVERSGP